MTRQIINDYFLKDSCLVSNAKQTTVVEMVNNRLKLKIDKKAYSAEELING